MFDMMKMMGKMKEVQAKVKEAQANLVNIKADGEAGAGMVKVTVNGLKQIESIDIDQDIIKAEDKEMIQDLTIAAINKAIQEVEILSKEEMKKHTEGLIPNIPGLDLGGLF
jgi:hypothetical protein